MMKKFYYGLFLGLILILMVSYPVLATIPASPELITVGGKEYTITGTTPCNGTAGDKWEPEAGKGDVRFRLDWDKSVDLDLHVIPPKGEEVWFDNKNPSTGGELDIDNGALCPEYVPGKPENIFWPEGKAPRGQYKVHVVYYKTCSDKGPISFTVKRWVNNVLAETKSGTVNEVKDSIDVFDFTY